MNNRKNRGGKMGFQKLITLLLAAILAINVMVLLSRISGSQYYNSPYEYSDMIRLVRKRDYPGLLEDISYNHSRELTPQKDVAELEALAAFYQKAFLYHAYKTAGDTIRADETADVLRELSSQMSEPEILEAAEDIRRQFLS